ncbi:MAG: alpha/beta hydrolase, partial [Gammaproteobacteria bacterium]|nr:alpha/beta hydrolase [Gammaproteobacteria bacterium]
MPFEHYQKQEQARIRRLRRDLDGENAEWIVEANSPFQLTPDDKESNKGILLMHGLFDSPFTMRDLATHYQKLGFHVRCILLSGHGTIPEQLKDIEYQQWLEDVSLALSSFKKVVSNIYLSGFSTGGLLAIYQGLIDPSIKGIVALSPALNLKPMIALGTHILSWTKMMIERDYWNIDRSEQDPTKYSAFPMNAPHQVALLVEQFKRLNKYTEFTTPLFIASSEDDETVSSHAALHFFERQSNSKNRCIYYSNDIVDNEDMRITIEPSR